MEVLGGVTHGQYGSGIEGICVGFCVKNGQYGGISIYIGGIVWY